MKTNFHIHTTFSDGVFSPAETVRYHRDLGVEALSVTDHDSIAGLDETRAECERLGVKFVSGIELSSYGRGEVHILGYNFDYKSPEFEARLSEFTQLRRDRIKKVIDKLDKAGISLNLSGDEIFELKGRVHVAKELIKQGHAATVNEAFDRYLGTGKPAHIEGNRVAPLRAVQLIKDFGGVASIAHPSKLYQEQILNLLIEGLIPYGLKGLECYYPSHNETDTKNLLALAARYRLHATGGTDFHGEGGNFHSSYRDDKIDRLTLSALGIRD